jgi:hypothetical protein
MEEGPPEQANKTLPFCLFLKRSKMDLYLPINTNVKQDLEKKLGLEGVDLFQIDTNSSYWQ